MDVISHHHGVASRQRSHGGCLAVPVREAASLVSDSWKSESGLNPKTFGTSQQHHPGMTSVLVTAGYDTKADPEPLLEPRLPSHGSWCTFERTEADLEAENHLIRTEAVKTSLLSIDMQSNL